LLEKVDLNQYLDKKQYKIEMKALETRLAELQQEIAVHKIPVAIAFEGWSAAGKGTLISKVLYPLDPRQFNVYTMAKVTEEAQMRPFLWSYWTRMPMRGRITIFDKSWNRAILPQGETKWRLRPEEKSGFYYDVNSFEEQWANDGVVLIKLFLHISKEEQMRRFKELEKGADTAWRVDAEDWRQNNDYAKHLVYFEEMIQNTNSGRSQWNVIEANDKYFAAVKIYKVIIARLEEELARLSAAGEEKTRRQGQDVRDASEISILSGIDPNGQITEKDYKKKLGFYQNKLAELGYKLYAKRRSVVIVYEGWDAAGKGGNIKRLTQELDPRGYEVVPVGVPTQEELNHHYLWRFYQKLPKDGHMAIFDRSWYGRVLVERIEKFCATEEWQRAYKEINDMELHWANHGAILLKFWLQIDKEEQYARFKDREDNPLKRYKITEDDWRNRSKWDEYEKAVDELLFKTSTAYAPWTIVESNNKKFARIKVLQTVVEELEKRL